MIKLLGSLLLIISSTVIGYLSAYKLSVKENFLRQYLQFINYIESEIKYSKRALCEIISNYNNSSEINLFLNLMNKKIKTENDFNKIWKDSIDELPKSYGLSKQEKKIFYEFGQELGTTDVNGQISLCRLNKNVINSKLKVLIDEKSKKNKLYLVIGSSFGICLTLLLL